jgi:hypothetical protein
MPRQVVFANSCSRDDGAVAAGFTSIHNINVNYLSCVTFTFGAISAGWRGGWSGAWRLGPGRAGAPHFVTFGNVPIAAASAAGSCMGAEGRELASKRPEKQQITPGRGTESGTPRDDSAQTDPDLIRIVRAWPILPAAARAAVLAIVAEHGSGGQG